ncbi:hypothetical protein IDJ77_13035 [Mucilaginibacter sp. ZT4R22]|uniref:Uncharacterized protein n=1 Tax=Mucilaginibacter pankratovii TaxID=2772110 RepID=A0ABR7WQY6_9SPHI|nr:hypothetical protein [Mucilaginibacter pankratovii]MBD1364738.1 hypothetical protein [Mucilaginibacter pankratovii]
MENMALFHGVIVYDIIVDNMRVLILSGIYASSDDFKISNEIAKRGPLKEGEKDIEGHYKSRYIETIGEPEKAIECDLIITENKNHEAYEFEWKNTDGLHQTGIGIKINSKQIAVSYINV